MGQTGFFHQRYRQLCQRPAGQGHNARIKAKAQPELPDRLTAATVIFRLPGRIPCPFRQPHGGVMRACQQVHTKDIHRHQNNGGRMHRKKADLRHRQCQRMNPQQGQHKGRHEQVFRRSGGMLQIGTPVGDIRQRKKGRLRGNPSQAVAHRHLRIALCRRRHRGRDTGQRGRSTDEQRPYKRLPHPGCCAQDHGRFWSF